MQALRIVVLLGLTGALMATLEGCVPVAVFGAGMELGASAADERGFGGVVSDSALTQTVRYRLMKHDFSVFSGLSASVYQGTALLTGQVPNEQVHQDVLRIVREIGGVKKIEDELKVGSSIGLGQLARDSMITAHLNSLLMLDQNINSLNYRVKTENGVVYLTGIAQSREELRQAVNHARTLEGVRQVVSHVTVKPGGRVASMEHEKPVGEVEEFP